MSTFILCAKTPHAERLATLGYAVTDQPGVYRSDNLYVAHITLLVLNELRDEPHNALVKAFASRQREKAKAFRLLRRFWRLSAEMLLIFEVLQTIWSLPEGATMNEILTPERVLEIGQEWKRILIEQTPKAELKALLSTELKQELIDQGIEQGIEQGETAMRHLLLQLLQRRLGEVPAAVHERLQQCTLAELNTLINPALDAVTWADFMAALPTPTA